MRNRSHLPDGLTAANLVDAESGKVRNVPGHAGLAASVARLQDDNLTWRDVHWLPSITRLPVLVKGIVRHDDAQRALDCCAAAIVVSKKDCPGA